MTKPRPRLNRNNRCWLIERLIDGRHLIAAADSELDKKFISLQRAGILELSDAMFGNHYYTFTDPGRRLLINGEEARRRDNG